MLAGGSMAQEPVGSGYLLNEGQSSTFSQETNRIYRPGYSEVREPNWGLRNRVSGWSQRVREITRPYSTRPYANRAGYLPLENLPQSESVSIPIEEETSFSIDIPEVSESTSLLGSSGTAGAGAATFGSVAAGTAGSITTGSIATAAGITTAAGVVAGGVGYLAHKLSSGATLPGHEFIGPGNIVDKQEPVDKDDAIAKEHDLAYQNAKSKQDIIKADNDAINKFDADYNVNGNIHSKIGSIGLQLKTAIEHKFGVIYPSISGT